MFDEEDVEKYINDMRKRLGKQTNPEKSAEGDVLMGSIVELDEESNDLANGISSENTSLSIDFIKLKTIKTKFINKKKGSRIVFNPAKAFKNDSEVGSLLGIGTEKAKEIEADFAFTINEISHIEEAELNEEFFSKVYENADIKTEEELREKVTKDIELTYLAETDRKFFNDVVDALIKKTNLNLPDEFLKSWIKESNSREEEDKRISDVELDQQYEAYRDSLRWQLIEEELVVSNNLLVTEEELKARIKEILGLQAFGGMDDEANNDILDQVTNSVMQNKEEVKRVSDQIIEQKLTKLFKESLQPKEVNMKYDDFVEMIKKENKA